MKLSHSSATAFALALAATLAVRLHSRADGMRELYSDKGLYTGDSDQPGTARMDIYTWSQRGITIDGNATGGEDTPEGLTILQAQVPSGWGGYGFFHVLMDNSAVVQEYDYSAYQGGFLRFQLRSNTDLFVEIEFVSPGGTIQKVGTNVTNTTDVWREVVLPLSGFTGPAPLNLKRVRGPFLITAPSGSLPKSWAVDHVRMCKPVTTIELFPKNPQVAVGSRLQLTVEGKTAAGEAVQLYPTMSLAAGNGSIAPVSPKASQAFIFASGSAVGDVTVTASADASYPTAVQANFVVHVSASNNSSTLGLYSENAPQAIDLDTNSKLLLFPPNIVKLDPPILVLDRTIDDPFEGQESLKTTVDLQGPKAFCGWTIQWGLEGSPDTATRDMSAFYEGNLRFALKAPPALLTNLVVGIRSGNIAAGNELSKVSLTNFAVFDDQWHLVKIPLREFAKSRPWADLSRVKGFFTLAIVGDTHGQQAFLIDDLAWEPSQPSLQFASLTYSPAPAAFRFRLTGPSGLPFVIESSSTLTNWEELVTGTLGPFEYSYTNAAPFRFFRARSR